MARRNTKWAKKVMEAWLSDLDGPGATKQDKECIQYVIAGLQPLVAQQGDRAMVAALEMCNLILANIVSRRADFQVLDSFTKENLDMALKANDRTCKVNSAAGPSARAGLRSEDMGLGSRLKPLMKRAKRAIEASIVEAGPRATVQDDAGGACESVPLPDT
ncbi:MAG: hypothetical protein HUU46_24850 [Candidatus Hydrogenedentes bacterium]|nr:hypothetical protein [Candidatus Hydrogenedentota bacterium]